MTPFSKSSAAGRLMLALATVMAAPKLLAEEAASQVVGYTEAVILPGRSEPLTPPFFQHVQAAGSVTAIPSAGVARISWAGAADPASSALWLGLTGKSAGRVFYGTAGAVAGEWILSETPGGPPITGPATASPFTVGNRLASFPFWRLGQFPGNPAAAGLLAGADAASADGYAPGGSEFWVRAADPEAHWALTGADPAADMGAAAFDTLGGPAFFSRNAAAGAAVLLPIQGAACPVAMAFPIEPGTGPTNAVFRPDGKEILAASPVDFLTNGVAATGLAGGPTAAQADKLLIWARDLNAWESFYWNTTQRRWISITRNALATNQKALAGDVVLIDRPASLPRGSLRLPAVSNAVNLAAVAFPIIDTDRDKLADAWEKAVTGSPNLGVLTNSGDNDGDSLTNFQEYLLGGNPLAFDAPARPVVEIRLNAASPREAWIRVPTAPGCRYRLETRLATDTAWRVIPAAANAADFAGTGGTVELRDPLFTSGNRIVRFYRTVALPPLDRDRDLLSDYEEEFAYHTDPTKSDTDLDGYSDRLEVLNRMDPLDFYNGRMVTLTTTSGNSQYAAPGVWSQEGVGVTVKFGAALLPNAPVTFVTTSGVAEFSALPGGGPSSSGTPSLATRANAVGVATAFVRLDAAAGAPVQGRAIAEVSGKLITSSFLIYPTMSLVYPTDGLLARLRPDEGVTFAINATNVASWAGPAGTATANGATTTGPKREIRNSRAWLTFDGTQKLDFGASLATNDFNIFFAAAPTGVRAATSPTVPANTVIGGSGQFYLFAADIAPGENITYYTEPARPASLAFSLWRQTDLFGTPYGTYHFTPATNRYDDTDGMRLSPPPTGEHSSQPLSKHLQAFLNVPANKAHFANFNAGAVKVRRQDFIYLGRKWAEEDFYRVDATTWKGNSGSPAYGGIAHTDYNLVGPAGFGLSVGATSMGAFELRNYWLPSISYSAGPLPSTGAIGTVRVVNQIPTLSAPGHRSTASGVSSPSTLLRGPRYIGGLTAAGNNFKGSLGDVLIYDRDLTSTEREQVEDYLAATYRNAAAPDRDRPTTLEGLPDWWERQNFGGRSDPNATPTADTDGDLVNNLREFQSGSNPWAADTDGDGWTDDVEYFTKKTSLTSTDTDGDLLPDPQDPLPLNPSDGRADANGNGIPDGIDYVLTHPGLTDTDGDGVPDLLQAAE